MQPGELERRALERARAERVRIVKLAGEDRYLARSRTVEPGAYYELTVSSWGSVRCTCPAFTFRGLCKHSAALHEKLSQRKARAIPDPAWPIKTDGLWKR